MSRQRIGYYGKLNVVAHPHPPGVYREIFERASAIKATVKVRGDRYARIGKISISRDNVFSGVIAFWTEISAESSAVEKASLDESSLQDLGVKIPEGIGFNSRIFAFSFNERNHTLVVELKNNEREVVSIRILKNAIEGILVQGLPDFVQEFDVHIKSRSNAVDELISVDSIRSVHIIINLPNPDNIDEIIERKVQKKRREMAEAKVKREEIRLTKERGAGSIEFGSGMYRAELELAAQNGSVEVSGKNDGRPVRLSTSDFPDVIREPLGSEETSPVATRRIARL